MSRDERNFPCANEARYESTVDAGRARLAGSRLLVLMLARDCDSELHLNIERLADVMEASGDGSRAFVLENDSLDDTCGVLEAAAGRHDWLVAKCLTLRRKKWTSVRSKNRAKHMAWYRNEAATFGLTLVDAPDFVLVMDPDVAWFSALGLMHSVGLQAEQQWVACASNGLRQDQGRWVQADAWAFRTVGWKPLSFSQVQGTVPARGQAPMPLKSAFGGACLYEGRAWSDISERYAGGDCEHIALHRQLAERGQLVLNPSQLVVYRW